MKGGQIKLLRSNTATGLIIIAFLASCWLGQSAYWRHQALQRHLEALTVRLRVAQDYRWQIERKKKIVARINRFLDRAESMGLTPSQWSTYDVDFDQPVSFYEMAQIIDQCTSSQNYIFKPQRLQIKTHAGLTEYDRSGPPEVERTAATDFKGDVQLTLQGMFYTGPP